MLTHEERAAFIKSQNPMLKQSVCVTKQMKQRYGAFYWSYKLDNGWRCFASRSKDECVRKYREFMEQAEMKDKRFEHRYLVLKNDDVKKYLTRDQRETIEDLNDIVVLGRVAEGRGVNEGIFIANDWPEYQSASAALYNRISGKDIYKGHSNLADMMSTHIDSLITILERVAAEDVEEDTGYLNHEIRALRDIKVAIEAEKSNAI